MKSINYKISVPLVDLKASYKGIKNQIDRAIAGVLGKTNFIMGDEVTGFETAFTRYIGTKYAIGVSSGTAAIHLILKALGIGAGDEVILPSHTFTATAEPVVWLGAKPVFADIAPDYTLDPTRLEKLITAKTKAVIPVHLYGLPADMDGISKIASRYKISVIEDTAQAHGAVFGKKKTGTLGIAAAFSFYPGKNLGAYGDAGCVVTDNSLLADAVRKLRNHGRTEKYRHQLVGYGERLDTLQAAVLSVKLKHLERWNRQRRTAAALYDRRLKDIPQVTMPETISGRRHVYHLYVIQVEQRDKLKNYLKEKGIGCGIHYPIPLHLQPAYKFLRYKRGDFPDTEKISGRILSLPIYPEITTAQIKYITKCVKEFYS
ncbi:erythromycin biosynthesis sensory transduction protein eryC1 [Candidatus Gottesmanbacteria bacterium RIFCSPLOWO2_01_FULL_40_10]|nr:MAG: erythromycin biosynthesis sensory transduction protein eryC1 [Candidatus Gottesmanbacteria bacterium RIFCSPLOWO2_01_FULL_40_10]OGG33238.1 MAG: erythromycin biosynthesis sensory transduction protein eryC1 [Candidatus Gottesmanbacteria bacterium RIFCSPLOWO2_02_FULL_40_10]